VKVVMIPPELDVVAFTPLSEPPVQTGHHRRTNFQSG
jgi:hypothetical protein